VGLNEKSPRHRHHTTKDTIDKVANEWVDFYFCDLLDCCHISFFHVFIFYFIFFLFLFLFFLNFPWLIIWHHFLDLLSYFVLNVFFSLFIVFTSWFLGGFSLCDRLDQNHCRYDAARQLHSSIIDTNILVEILNKTIY
jgi:hypothetical protein